jgi:hypothetical protein
MTSVQIIGLVFACIGLVAAIARAFIFRAEFRSRRELTEALRENTRLQRDK